MPEFTEPRIASLSPDVLAKVQSVEQQLGDVCVVAYQYPLVPAPLSAGQLKKLRALEREVGICLVAYQKPH